MRYAEVAVNSTYPHRQAFSYAVSDGMDVRPGHAVYVPFGRLTLQGVVIEVHDTPVFSEPEKIRAVRSVIGEEPLLDEARVALALWIAAYYIAPLFHALALLLPPGFRRKPVTLVRPLVVATPADEELTARQHELLEAILGGATDIEALRRRVTFRAVEPALAQLERRGLIEREFALSRPSVGPKFAEFAALAVDPAEAERRIAAAEPRKPSRRADLLDLLAEAGSAPLAAVAKLADSRANLARLARSGDISIETGLVALLIPPDEARARAAALRRTRRATQAHALVRALAERGEQKLGELRSSVELDTPTVRWLGDRSIIRIDRRAVERDPLAGFAVTRHPPADLLPAQADAADAIYAAVFLRRAETFLLHGVTGSGKTEVYLRALEGCIEAGRRAIVMVPEIALTPQTVRRFHERFERVAVLHSGLSDGERFDQWHAIQAGRYDVVIGSRSAVFAPQPDLGIIVVDEEHEWTYKQHDASPRYHARNVAIELARLRGAAVVLGSATPDVCSYERASRGEYRLLSLPERVRPVIDERGASRPTISGAMPRVAVVDLREELKQGNRSIFSRELHGGIQHVLAAGEQAILFLNRRGTAGHVQCRDCGFVPVCSRCDIALTYHRTSDRLLCHQCNRQQRLRGNCRQCGSPRIRLLGIGVEKVEAEAARAFPGARLLRWDRDVTRGRGAHQRILSAFLAREADILIGTQMLAKGLDLPAVTLVGIVSADVGLHRPDFRSGERVFQVLTQVAGRAGRAERPGTVVMQTYTPDHYAIQSASRYDYGGFADAELAARRRTGYPPFSKLVKLVVAHTNRRYVRDEAARLQRALTQRRAEAGSDIQIVGPSAAYVPRLRGRWRWQLLLRGRDPATLLRDFVLPPDWSVDVDPASTT